MLFKKITILDEHFEIKQDMYVGVSGERIEYIGCSAPDSPERYGTVYDGAGKLLMCGFYNGHAHTPMTLMRGYGENMPLSRWLNDRIFPFEAQLTGKDIYHGMMLGIAESLRFGIVSSSDMYNFCEDMARAVIESGCKGNIGRHIVAFDNRELEKLECFTEGKAFYRQYNGAAGGRVLADMSLHAEYTSTPKAVRELATYAANGRKRIHVHVSETRDEVAACKERHGKTPVEYLADCGLFDTPAVAAHCVHLDDRDFSILAEKKVTVASCPISNLKLASGTCNVNKLYMSGVNVSIGTDSVASNNNLNFIEEMKFFSIAGKGAFLDPSVITPREALFSATAAGATAQGRTDCGLLSEGYKADLIVMDIDKPNMYPVHDLLNNIIYSASGSDIVMTMADGQVLYKDGEYTTIDIEKTIAEARAAARGVLSKL